MVLERKLEFPPETPNQKAERLLAGRYNPHEISDVFSHMKPEDINRLLDDLADELNLSMDEETKDATRAAWLRRLYEATQTESGREQAQRM
jgi:hypothetical protein